MDMACKSCNTVVTLANRAHGPMHDLDVFGLFEHATLSLKQSKPAQNQAMNQTKGGFRPAGIKNKQPGDSELC